MKMRRRTPEDDEDRIMERLRNFHRNNISDRETFDYSFNRLFDMHEKELTAKQRKLRDSVFDRYSSKYNIPKESEFRKAGGKDFERDKQRQAKRVVTTRKEYEKSGASNVDLKGYDTPSRIKRKVVYARKDYVTIRGRKIAVYRDRKGRFASVRTRA